MLAEIASISSVTRWLTATRSLDEVPEDWGPMEYGPKKDSAEVDDVAVATVQASEDRARAIAAELRG